LELIEALEEERELALQNTAEAQKERKWRYDKRLSLEDIKARDFILLFDSRHKKFPG
jgi:hypothetical protein